VKDIEKELVRQLGEKIGYGNMMQLASDLWEEKMKENGWPTSGVFVPVLKYDVDKQKSNKRYTIEDIEKCVEFWGLCKVERVFIENFLKNYDKI
jgi:hypothetical protein